jgi:diacylglycerol kinase family enzyme
LPDRNAAAVPIPVIVNRAGGTAASLGDALADRITAAFTAAGVAADVRLVDGSDIVDAVRSHADAPVVVVGGGDGTLGSAAQARVESGGGAFGILPLGTRNHLALELGIPNDLEGAAALIARGRTRRIDLATVNDVGFVNNASVGLYPLLVRWRDVERDRRGLPKWLATLPAVWATLRRLPHHRLRLTSGTGVRQIVTPLLFVGNNRYSLERGRVGARAALDDGLLSVFAVGAHSRLGMVWLAVRTILGFSEPARDFAALGDTDSFTVVSRASHIDIALDGEVRRLPTPLRFAVRPRALTVIVPGAGDADGPSADGAA